MALNSHHRLSTDLPGYPVLVELGSPNHSVPLDSGSKTITFNTSEPGNTPVSEDIRRELHLGPVEIDDSQRAATHTLEPLHTEGAACASGIPRCKKQSDQNPGLNSKAHCSVHPPTSCSQEQLPGAKARGRQKELPAW